MKILYISKSYSTHDYQFLSALSGTHHEVYFARLVGSPSFEKPIPTSVKQVFVKTLIVGELKPPHLIYLLPKIDEIISAVDPDLVQAGDLLSGAFLAVETCASKNIPVISMSWGRDILYDSIHSTLSLWLVKQSLLGSDALICDSQIIEKEARKYLKFTTSDFFIQFPWGVNLEKFSFKPKQPGKHTIVLSTRSWEPIYGTLTILRVFHWAHRINKNIRLILLGDGSLRGSVENYIQLNGLSEVVYRPGTIPHDSLPKFYHASDIYISASLTDGTSVSLLEAMACGTLPVVSELPGNREWLNYDHPHVDKPEEFAKELLELAELSPTNRHLKATLYRKIVEKRADWKSNIQILFNAYKRFGR